MSNGTLDLFDEIALQESVSDIAYSVSNHGNDIGKSDLPGRPSITDIGQETGSTLSDIGNAGYEPKSSAAVRAWCARALDQAIASRNALKEIQACSGDLEAVLDAIAYVSTAKRDSYARALVMPADEATSFGWILRQPALATHIALLHFKRVDPGLVPMMPDLLDRPKTAIAAAGPTRDRARIGDQGQCLG